MSIKLDVLPSPAVSSCGVKSAPVATEPPPEEYAPVMGGCGCDNGVSRVALMLTRRCNMSCGHCSVESSPRIKGEPTPEELLELVRESARNGVRSLLITGGEPMLREEVVLRLLRECQILELAPAITTNGFWGKNPEKARAKVRELCKAGLQLLTVSYDRYHAEFMGVEPVLHIAQAAREQNLSMNVNVTRVAGDLELDAMLAPFANVEGIRMRFYDVQPLGRARNLDATMLRAEVKGFCNACETPAITDDGRVTACNGPSYFAPPDSPLAIGSLHEESLQTLFERHRNDPILEMLRTYGPARMAEELSELDGFESLFEGAPPAGMCDLCRRITTNPEAVRVLRERLSEPRRVAERFAARQVIMRNRAKAGAYNIESVNGVGAARVFLRAARHAHQDAAARWNADAVNVLGRADLDWNNLTGLLLTSGLARPLLPVLHDSQLTRWAPEFFVQRIQKGAQHEGMREAVGRDALERLAVGLRAVKARGVLLKGAAMAAVAELSKGEGQGRIPRSSCDIDVYVEPAKAVALRAHLLAHGFTGSPQHLGKEKHIHHLSPLVFKGVMVEIHTRIMKAQWGLPEREMLDHARPIGDPVARPKLVGLYALDDEALLLHAIVHATQHGFRHGLKAAWDIAWILDAHPDLDWDRLAAWVKACRMPLGFRAPARVLCRELGLKLPPALLEATADSGEHKMREQELEAMASSRLFCHVPPNVQADQSRRNTMGMLLQETWWGRAEHLTHLLMADLREVSSLKKEAAPQDEVRFKPLWRTRHSVRDYRKLRSSSCGS